MWDGFNQVDNLVKVCPTDHTEEERPGNAGGAGNDLIMQCLEVFGNAGLNWW
jgi:hypothetical protein